MPCLLLLAFFGFPRLVLFLVWFFSGYLGRAYHTTLWPLLGFFLMPVTTLAYAWAINTHGSVEGFSLAILVLAVLIDLGLLRGGSKHRGGWKKNG